MNTGPPKPRPWVAGEAATVGTNGVRRLTMPDAFALYAGVIGYHVPRRLANARRYSEALAHIR